MAVAQWEDPFNKPRGDISELWEAGCIVPPAHLRTIRQRQKALLPIIQEWLKATDEALARARSTPEGLLLASVLEKDVQINVLYRRANHPSVLNDFWAMPKPCVPITFPASKKEGIPILDRLLPTQIVNEAQPTLEADADTAIIKKVGLKKAGEIPDAMRRAILAAEIELGLMRGVALAGCDNMPKERVVVYRPVLEWAAFWIKNMVSPITDLRYGEVQKERGTKERGLRSGALFELGNAPVKPQLN
jgi:hypothetical protein